MLPDDIIHRINSDFSNREKDYVFTKLLNMYGSSSVFSGLGVIRSILFLANGNLKEFNNWANSDDYRDILIYAEIRSGNYGHYFRMPFEEVERLQKLIQDELKERLIEENSLPNDFFKNDFK